MIRKMAFDFKKEYKEFYLPPAKPVVVTVPKANYIAVRGKGNPNEEGGAYQQAIGILYAVAYTLKMSYKTDHRIEGFYDYVVPPLEGFWWQEGIDGVDYSDKSTFCWMTASKKKKIDCSKAEFLTIDEGLCVQIMHIGPYDDEPASVALMDQYLAENGYLNDLSAARLHHEIYLSDARKVAPHHEIYLSDARKVAPKNWKTVIRHPIKRA